MTISPQTVKKVADALDKQDATEWVPDSKHYPNMANVAINAFLASEEMRGLIYMGHEYIASICLKSHDCDDRAKAIRYAEHIEKMQELIKPFTKTNGDV